MPLTILEWYTEPGQALPQPRLADDSVAFPPAVVKQVREWLQAGALGLDGHKPTAQTLQVVGVRRRRSPAAPSVELQGVIPQGTATERIQINRWVLATVEILHRDAVTGIILAKHRCAAAREIDGVGLATGRVILGPELLKIQTHPIN